MQLVWQPDEWTEVYPREVGNVSSAIVRILSGRHVRKAEVSSQTLIKHLMTDPADLVELEQVLGIDILSSDMLMTLVRKMR